MSSGWFDWTRRTEHAPERVGSAGSTSSRSSPSQFCGGGGGGRGLGSTPTVPDSWVVGSASCESRLHLLLKLLLIQLSRRLHSAQLSPSSPPTQPSPAHPAQPSPSPSASCESGFMPLEEMRMLLGEGIVGKLRVTHKRQQITPAMRFTCTGWIIGFAWKHSDTFYPELQTMEEQWRQKLQFRYSRVWQLHSGNQLPMVTKGPRLRAAEC